MLNIRQSLANRPYRLIGDVSDIRYVPDNGCKLGQKEQTMGNLAEAMDFDHVVHVRPDGTFTDTTGQHAPEVYVTTDENGQILADDEKGMIDLIRDHGWEVWTTGYSGQYGYRGPIMHSSELISNEMETDMYDSPGYYVACAVEILEGDDWDISEMPPPPAGWIICRKDA